MIRKRLLARLLILAALFAVVWFVRHRQQQAGRTDTPTPTRNTSGQNDTRPDAAAPAYVLRVLDYVQKNGRAPEGYVGGREFQNREKRLPAEGSGGRIIRYREWDVHPKAEGKNRGAERLVTGSDQSAWYTKDHYKSFLKIE